MGFRNLFKKVLKTNQRDEKTTFEKEIIKEVETNESSQKKKILFVCQSNLVVSPIAEAIFKQKFDKNNNFKVYSAGLDAVPGNRAQDTIIELCSNHGIDLARHLTRKIDDFSINNMDLVLTSTCSLRRILKKLHPNLNIYTINEYAGNFVSKLDINDSFSGEWDINEIRFNEIERSVEHIYDIIEEPSEYNNFKYLDNMIHAGNKEIVLDTDIILNDGEELEYLDGIELDVDDIVIDGAGHAINAKTKARIFRCTGKNITIKNLLFKYGFAEYGGAIYNNNNGDLTIFNSIFKRNASKRPNGKSAYSHDGGAICNYGKLIIIKSEFYENRAMEDGGAVKNSGELIIEKSLFSKNMADKNGGAIENWGNLNIVETTLSNNFSDYSGAIDNYAGETILSKSTFDSHSTGFGGVIRNYGGIIRIFKCEIMNNNARNIIHNMDYMQMHNSDIYDNTVETLILNDEEKSNLTIFNGKIKNNTAGTIISNNGKTLSIDKTFFGNDVEVIIDNKADLALIEPKIRGIVGKIFNNGIMSIRNPTEDLLSRIYGAGKVETNIIPDEEQFDFGHLDRLIHESTTKEIILDGNISFENYERYFYEGGVELDIDGLVIDGNGKTIDALDKSRIFTITGKNITLKNIIFKNGCSYANYDNKLNSNGGAIKVVYHSNLNIENCKFLNNSSEESGGAIDNHGELCIFDCALTNNTANEHGGAIYNLGSLTISKSKLNKNKSSGSGGAIITSGEFTMSKTELNENESSGDGGAIDNHGELTISKSSLNKNKSSRDGGAITSSANLTISKTELNENKSEQHGGAIYNNDNLIMTDVILTDNRAEISGGAVSNKDEELLEITDYDIGHNYPDDICWSSEERQKMFKKYLQREHFTNMTIIHPDLYDIRDLKKYY